MKKIMTAVAIITAMAILCARAAFAAETSYIVNLHKKIKTDFKELEKGQREAETRISQINKDISGLVERIESTENAEARDQLVNQYYKLRAQTLYERVKAINLADGTILRIADNMRQLDTAMAETNRNDDGTMLTKADLPAISGTLRGLADIMRPIYAMKSDDPRIQYMGQTIQNLDGRFRYLMDNQKQVSLADRVAYMEDLHAFIGSVRQVAEQERFYLLTKVYTILANNIIKFVDSFGKSTTGLNLALTIVDDHKKDAQVDRANNFGSPAGQTASREVSWDHIGQYGGAR